MKLKEHEKEELLCLAREAIETSLLKDKGSSVIASKGFPGTELMCGAFVSVYVDDDLRGCIGTFSEDESLITNVKRMAVSAATADSRFDPILPEELDRLSIEISVLTPRKRINDISEISIGTHGIYMKYGTNRGTLLPHVAVNQNWSVAEFLGNCSRYKAGIGWEGWKAAELYTYEALCFRSFPNHKC
jgi:AmmeMemoRadiSam system protein A